VPVPVSGALIFAMVSSGELYACGVTTAGTAYCWGGDFGGDLGNGMIATLDCLSCGESNTPMLVSSGLTFATVTAEGSHTCGVTTGGKAYCWGDNSYGETGNNSPDSSITTPVPVSGGLVFSQLSAGYRHTCGVATSGVAFCWGANFTGQLGNDNTTNSPIPVIVSGGLKFVSVSGGFDHTCGVTTGGAAYCWGLNIASELGDGTTTGPQQCSSEPCSTTPSAVASGLTFASVSAGAGGFHSCGLTPSGSAYCWGDNARGELGNGTTTSSATPVAVAGGLTFREVSAGYRHTCGVTKEDVAYCWGDNYSGNLGTGTQNDALSPTPVLGPQVP
jgi:alpha-tubulin suppressor-like RCC1 family protein